MKLAVIAANGKIGKLITNEALDQGFDVTAIVRGDNQTHTSHVLHKDLFELTTDDLLPFDVVVDAAGFWLPETLHQHKTSLIHLTTILKDTNVLLIVVGGAGSLYLDTTHTKRLMDLPNFQKNYLALAQNMSQGLDFLRTVTNISWLYVSPAEEFQALGNKTGHYALAGEEWMKNEKDQSYISYADYALGIISILKNPPTTPQRISLYTP